MYLHEAMVEVLETTGPLSPTDLADEINRRRLYVRKDGQPLQSNQVSARAKNYPHLFVRSPGKIALVTPSVPTEKLRSRQKTSEPVRAEKDSASAKTTDLMFIDIGTVGTLMEKGLPRDKQLENCGVYRISVPNGYAPRFIGPQDAKAAGNVVKPWTVDRLEAKWVSGTDVIYFGLAGSSQPRSLRKRLQDLLRHGSGRTTDSGPHKGGEILWQLADYRTFSIAVAATGNPPAPRRTEKELIEQFEQKFGALPFANRQR